MLFSGVPAPLLFVSNGQVNAIVPNAAAGKSSIDVQVEYRGVRSRAVTLPVLKALPAIFSLNGSGEGQAAVLNDDGTVNGPANPAKRGSIISMFGTGGGESEVALADGEVVGNPPPRLTSKASVYFVPGEDPGADVDFIQGEVSYAGAVTGFVAGLIQVNVRVPESMPAGIAIPVLSIGDAWIPSPPSVRISVK